MAFDPKMITLPLTIGAEVFALAALWPLSGWATEARRGAGLLAAVGWIAVCIALGRVGVSFLVMTPGHGLQWMIARPVGWAALPLFIGFPDAVCVACGQSLARVGMPARVARALALAIGGVSAVVSPLLALVAGSGTVAV